MQPLADWLLSQPINESVISALGVIAMLIGIAATLQNLKGSSKAVDKVMEIIQADIPIQIESTYDDPKKVVNSNFRILEKYYDITLIEYRFNSRAAISMAILGFMVVVVGAGLAMSGIVTVGILTSITGIIGEAGTVLFFRQLESRSKEIMEYHKKLVSTQYLLTAISIAEGLSDESRERESRRIVGNLLFLSNQLHDSSSSHLFDGTTVSIDPSREAAQS